jgi:hypothetical protein
MQVHFILKRKPMHIQKFVDRIRGQEARGARDFIMSMQEAKDLHADITRLLLTLQTLQDSQSVDAQEPVVEMRVEGGTFK